MMGQSAIATYSCTALLHTNKTGILRADAAGYYEVVLGGLDIANSVNAYYPYEPAKVLFETSSQLQRRIRNGCLKGEYGHPKRQPGMSDRDFLARILEIRESEICCHIREVSLIKDFKDKDGRSCVGIIGLVKPSGPKADALAASLENPHENVCFSIRSLTHDEYQRGRLIKTLKTIVTWDLVNEPGLHIANKYMAPSLESLDSFNFTHEQFVSAKTNLIQHTGLESSGGMDLAAIERAYGWNAKDLGNRFKSSAW